MHSLINNVSLNGNFLLNIGQKADGNVPFEISERLLEAGEWLKVNGESVYGCGAFELPANLHDWGRITSKKTAKGTNLYLHLFSYPFDNKLDVTGVTTKPVKVYMLSDPDRKPLSFQHNGALLTVVLPLDQTDPYVSVVAVEYSGKPAITDGLVAKTIEGGFSFTPSNLSVPDGSLKITAKQRRGTIPAHIVLNVKKNLKWKVYVDDAGMKTFDVSYSYQGTKAGNSITIKAANASLIHKVVPSGKTVGEPNQDWVIDNFKSSRIGTVNFPGPGYYEIELGIMPEEGEEIRVPVAVDEVVSLEKIQFAKKY